MVIAGEITTRAQLDYQNLVRETIKNIGYNQPNLGFHYDSCGILTSINKQSPDIAQGVNEGEGLYKEQGAGDQGLMFGYACEETPELMPFPIMLAHKIVRELNHLCKTNQLSYLRPDAKTQVTVEYDDNHQPVRIHTVVISVQHAENTKRETIIQDMKSMSQNWPQKVLSMIVLFFM